ncbi:phage transcriptional repressor [Streptococcus pneumoniae]|uniref:Phage transcriptional repressor n=1 Tax=Streptococcus pneumoniae TaxID=1313 RepID=A0A4G3U7B4_STREE|nr:helix-turn-helix transcriptional regulator [Streptococcus pneumoniae]MBW5044853.1 helix-turn-helix transcriptional regulator [Streptococcus pneumoniae]MBW5225019.1 helix-turn-helix transcriptional regulator [Streptococcus pneumoniae]MDG8936204.1 helix-turn-helix domain-containing protein [Streptococcus pneumoniae]MDG9633688.1 helix-turn-helix domain-containing protein [Streptococcus pneumoniae]CIO60739.1 phage transcriptional repressor [Streptococcus pneumoniae]
MALYSETEKTNIAENIKLTRLSSGETLEQFAKRFGVSKAVVCNWEHKRNAPKLPTMLKIADLAGVSVIDLLNKKIEV